MSGFALLCADGKSLLLVLTYSGVGRVGTGGNFFRRFAGHDLGSCVMIRGTTRANGCADPLDTTRKGPTMPRVSGKLLSLEPVSGTAASGSSYAYMRAHVLDNVEVIALRVSETFGQLPDVGSDVDFVAKCNAGKNGRVYWDALRPFAAPAQSHKAA